MDFSITVNNYPLPIFLTVFLHFKIRQVFLAHPALEVQVIFPSVTTVQIRKFLYNKK